jgi:hypothetical protein
MKNELWTWTAADLANAIRNRKVSSREALEGCLARVDQINPRINAIVDMLTEEARAAADLADQAVKEGEILGPLHGVPITIKINVDYKLGRHLAGGTESGMVKSREVLANRLAGPGPGGLGAPLVAWDGAQLIGICRNQTGIDGEALATHQAFLKAPLHYRLEQEPQDVALPEPAMPTFHPPANQ